MLKITESQQRLYFLACPSCSKACGAAYGYEFTCNYCNNDFPSPKPMLSFQAELSNGTGSLIAYIEHREAEMLLGMSGEEIIEAKQEVEHLGPNDINKKLKDLQFLFQIRTSTNEARGRKFIRNTIIACLPSSDSSSASHSSEKKTSSSQLHKELLADIPMIESQESTSNIQEEHLPTKPIEHQISSTGKRGLDSKEHSTHRDLKHTKQD